MDVDLLIKLLKLDKKQVKFGDSQEEVFAKTLFNQGVDSAVTIISMYSTGKYSDEYLQRVGETE